MSRGEDSEKRSSCPNSSKLPGGFAGRAARAGAGTGCAWVAASATEHRHVREVGQEGGVPEAVEEPDAEERDEDRLVDGATDALRSALAGQALRAADDADEQAGQRQPQQEGQEVDEVRRRELAVEVVGEARVRDHVRRGEE